MANNKEPIAKKCRSLDISPAVMGYGNKKSTRNPGGNKRKKVSEYGTQLKEKQKVKFVYGVLEKQFHRYYLKAANMKGITGENLLKLLELRLDNVIYRLGIAKTRRMARQIIVHGQRRLPQRPRRQPRSGPSARLPRPDDRQRQEGGHPLLLREGRRRDHPA